jgi:hypothetical protein
VAGCLAYDPADRPLHAGAVAQALRTWLDGDAAAALTLAPAPAVDTSAITRPVPVTPPPPVRQPSTRPASGRRRALPIVPIVAAIAAILVVAVLAAFAANRPDPAADADPTPSPSTAPAATASPPPPDWLAGLVEKVEKDCGADEATAAEAVMTDMTEDEAKDYAGGLVKACKEADEGGGSDGGNGSGRGGGNGNGNGNGNGGD